MKYNRIKEIDKLTFLGKKRQKLHITPDPVILEGIDGILNVAVKMTQAEYIEWVRSNNRRDAETCPILKDFY